MPEPLEIARENELTPTAEVGAPTGALTIKGPLTPEQIENIKGVFYAGRRCPPLQMALLEPVDDALWCVVVVPVGSVHAAVSRRAAEQAVSLAKAANGPPTLAAIWPGDAEAHSRSLEMSSSRGFRAGTRSGDAAG